MLRLHMVHAEPGMVVAAEVRHPRHAHIVLLKPGATLDAAAIDHLRELRIGEVWIRYPSLEGVSDLLSPEVRAASRQVAVRLGRAIDSLVQDRHARLDYLAFRESTTSMLDSLAGSPTAALYLMEIGDLMAPHVRHAANTCFLSVLMGLKLDFYLIRERGRLSPTLAQDITSLGVGAMLHDIGLTQLEDDVVLRYDRDGATDDPAWRDHARLGFQMVREDFDAAVSSTVLHHHQRFDGTGFPARKSLSGAAQCAKGSEIHIFARIVAVADQFDRLRFPGHTMLSPITFAPAMPMVRALRTILSSPMSRWFDPVVLRALLHVAPAYAPGTMVTLSDGRRAAVAEWSPSDPCRPTVEIIPDRPGPWWGRDPSERVDLSRQSDLTIVEAEGADVAADNFAPKAPERFDLHRTERAIELAA